MGVSSSFYVDELRRREAARAEAASYNLAIESRKLSERVIVLTIVNPSVRMARPFASASAHQRPRSRSTTRVTDAAGSPARCACSNTTTATRSVRWGNFGTHPVCTSGILWAVQLAWHVLA
jgi:hypothetical protein